MGGAAIPRPAWVWGVAIVLLSGCASARSGGSRLDTGPAPVLGSEQAGLASWYGHPHHGRRTTSGEVFDMNALTAAHRTLPFGTRVRVTHEDTRRSVEVRINDRGPFVNGRIIDVSYAAAQRLGVVGAGVFRVRVRVVGLPSGKREVADDGPASQPASSAR